MATRRSGDVPGSDRRSATASCPADLDGAVGGAELGQLLNAWGKSSAADLRGDVGVDGGDLGAILHASSKCPG